MNNDPNNNDPNNNAMTDDHPNPQHELASAYLDAAASPAERAQVEASPELLALVASFTTVRALVAYSPAAATDTREAALAAAFAEFDAPALEAAADDADAAIIPLNAKRRWARPLVSIAAAVLLVGAIGVAASGGFSGDDSESASTGVDSSAKVAAADAQTEAQMTSNSLSMTPASTIGSIGGGAQAAQIIDTPEQLRALTSIATDTVPPTADLPEITAAASENTASADTLPATPERLSRPALGCLTSQQVFLADIQYQGVFAIAARDTVTGMTSAITDDCTVLATVGT